ncbi:hypothetical protein AwDysgo_02570 [Bacteroidales bacterium]|nr:hypothetical protein AwDysgo_02570 [Bacteroidales bacterium]
MYASAGEPWAPARKVWNQNAYNPVYVNDDLTIPSRPLNPANAFARSDGGFNRPFNNFLQQSTNLNLEGGQLFLAPDLALARTAQRLTYNAATDVMKVDLTINNNGSTSSPASLQASIHTVQAGGRYRLLNTSSISGASIAPGATKILTYNIPNFSNLGIPASFESWHLSINSRDSSDKKPTYYAVFEECASWNNSSDNLSFISGSRVMCQGATENLTFTPYDPSSVYRWYDAPVGGNLVYTGSSYTFTKNASKEQILYVDIYNSAGTVKITPIRDRVYAYLSPDSLVWTGLGASGDWHNHLNWRNPKDPNDDYPMANIPRSCTQVHISGSGSVSIHANLYAGASQTDYSSYSVASCNNITFAENASVAGTEKLSYSKVFLDLRLLSNRYYMISSPLKHMYTSDFYQLQKNPYDDPIRVFTQLYGQSNPQDNSYIEGNFSGTFNTPDVALSLGKGLALWVDDKQANENIHVPQLIKLPKHDLFTQLYDGSGPSNYPKYPLERGNEHRFIYEGYNLDNIPVNVTTASAGQYVMVGNPFMSHIDFHAFYAENSSLIENNFKVLDGAGSMLSYSMQTGGTGSPALSRYIAPLQSFLVQVKSSSINELKMAVSMSQVDIGSKLRSANSDPILDDLLTIDFSIGSSQSTSFLAINSNSLHIYDQLDVIGLFMKDLNGAAVYTVSADGKKLDINQIPEVSHDLNIGLGLRTDSVGDFRLSFGGLSNFAPGYDIFLNDHSTEKFYNLRSGSVLTFSKMSSDLFLDGRFSLSFKSTNGETGIVNNNHQSGIIGYSQDGLLEVLSTDGSLLQEVNIYDLQGRLLHSIKDVGSARYSIPIDKHKTYIVRAQNALTTSSIKLVGK